MMMNAIGEAIATWLIGMFVVSFIAGGVLVLLVVFGLPWLWALIKPWLHMVTG